MYGMWDILPVRAAGIYLQREAPKLGSRDVRPGRGRPGPLRTLATEPCSRGWWPAAPPCTRASPAGASAASGSTRFASWASRPRFPHQTVPDAFGTARAPEEHGWTRQPQKRPRLPLRPGCHTLPGYLWPAMARGKLSPKSLDGAQWPGTRCKSSTEILARGGGKNVWKRADFERQGRSPGRVGEPRRACCDAAVPPAPPSRACLTDHPETCRKARAATAPHQTQAAGHGQFSWSWSLAGTGGLPFIFQEVIPLSLELGAPISPEPLLSAKDSARV